MESGGGDMTPVERLRERLLLDPRDIVSLAELAALLEAAGDLPGAIDLHQRALRADPYRSEALLALGRLWAELGDRDRARGWWRRALALDPDCAEADAGLTALDAPDALSTAYIRTLFDQYAPRFDAELTGALAYRAPALVAALLARQALAPGSADILDLGCGTGLSGAALKPFARRLDGVDLSAGMVAQARPRGLYDSLAEGEACAYLREARRDWDVIAAVDMLNYVGKLAPLFAAAALRLRPGGLFAGTVEKREKGGVSLTAKRRYTHGPDYLTEALAAAGLALVAVQEAALRTEGGAPVVGIIFAARRVGAARNSGLAG